jgi:hypothetical protein
MVVQAEEGNEVLNQLVLVKELLDKVLLVEMEATQLKPQGVVAVRAVRAVLIKLLESGYLIQLQVQQLLMQ